jgi:hypothetical protein
VEGKYVRRRDADHCAAWSRLWRWYSLDLEPGVFVLKYESTMARWKWRYHELMNNRRGYISYELPKGKSRLQKCKLHRGYSM